MSNPSSAPDFIYGLNPAFEVLRAKRREVYRAYFSPNALRNPRPKKLASLCEQRGIGVESREKGRLIHIAGSREHQGVVLEVSPYPYAAFTEIIQSSNRLVLLDNIEDPHNAGAILRTAEVLGYPGILLPRKGVPRIYPSVVKASAGATEHLRIVREMNATQYIKKLAADEAEWQVVALDAAGDMAPHQYQLPPETNLLLVIGGENKGVHQFILNNSNAVLKITQHGKINSLNASVAAAIAMYSLQNWDG
ncbi:MAG: 23S rRNA (guanosine(2251)-2'-O)-methyltransferase RlmB [Lentisphaeria bacterium]